jgi:hypothetical protein
MRHPDHPDAAHNPLAIGGRRSDAAVAADYYA